MIGIHREGIVRRLGQWDPRLTPSGEGIALASLGDQCCVLTHKKIPGSRNCSRSRRRYSYRGHCMRGQLHTRAGYVENISLGNVGVNIIGCCNSELERPSSRGCARQKTAIVGIRRICIERQSLG